MDTKCLRSLVVWQYPAVSPTEPTTADLINQAEFPFEDSKWSIGLAISRMRAFNLQGVDPRSVRGNNDGEVMPNAGPYGIVGGIFR